MKEDDGIMTAWSRRPIALLAGLVLIALTATAARAGDLVVEIDHAVLLRLDADADIVHIANPSIADVALESPRLIFVVGLAVGQTGVHILDRDGNEMLAGSILVTANQSSEVTLNRSTTEITYSCSPDCSEVSVQGGSSAGVFDTAGASGDVSMDDLNQTLNDLGLTE